MKENAVTASVVQGAGIGAGRNEVEKLRGDGIPGITFFGKPRCVFGKAGGQCGTGENFQKGFREGRGIGGGGFSGFGEQHIAGNLDIWSDHHRQSRGKGLGGGNAEIFGLRSQGKAIGAPQQQVFAWAGDDAGKENACFEPMPFTSARKDAA